MHYGLQTTEFSADLPLQVICLHSIILGKVCTGRYTDIAFIYIIYTRDNSKINYMYTDKCKWLHMPKSHYTNIVLQINAKENYTNISKLDWLAGGHYKRYLAVLKIQWTTSKFWVWLSPFSQKSLTYFHILAIHNTVKGDKKGTSFFGQSKSYAYSHGIHKFSHGAN